MTANIKARAPAHDGGELKPSRPVKILYGLGQVAQSGGFDTALGFIFFYYTAVLGLSGALVGAAGAISLAFDAAVDPLIGSWSDNIRSRFGRRLPLMMASVAPIALSVGLLFSPPAHLPQGALFAWLTVWSVAVRSLISLFNVPYIALGAEMADGYVERSSVVAYRAVAGIVAAVLVTAIAYSVFFAGAGGLQRARSYPGFGWTAATLVAAGCAVCCLGVRRYAAALPRAATVTASIVHRLPGELAEILRNGSFRTLFFSSVLFYVAVGLNATLGAHSQVFVWRLQPRMMQLISYAYLAGILIGIPIAPTLSRRLEKRTIVVVGILMVLLVWIFLPTLRALGLFTATGAAAMPALIGQGLFAGVGVGLIVIAYPSMMADAADEHELLFGRRREGLYFSGLGFAAKAASGLGVLLA
ncbi:MAG: MFS transporter, partial [Caulobacteraceae bacterium]|nr:MFS transporter [Caulobacteraceae bacterium]